MSIMLSYYPKNKTLKDLLDKREQAIKEMAYWTQFHGGDTRANQVRLWQECIRGIEGEIVERTILSESGPE